MSNLPPIRLTVGVQELSEGYALPEAGVFVPYKHPQLRAELLDTGLASEVSAAWWRSKTTALVIKPDASAPVLRSIIHNLRGMLRCIFGLSLFAAFAFISNNAGLIGICLASALFLLSILLHEAGHVLVFRWVAPKHYAVLVSAGIRCHMVRPVLRRRKELAVVLAGPLAPSLLTLVFLVFAGYNPFLFWAWAAIASAHAISLVVPVGDGANLRLAVRSSR